MRIPKQKEKWTLAKLQASADKFPTKQAWMQGDPRAYGAAKRRHQVEMIQFRERI